MFTRRDSEREVFRPMEYEIPLSMSLSCARSLFGVCSKPGASPNDLVEGKAFVIVPWSALGLRVALRNSATTEYF